MKINDMSKEEINQFIIDNYTTLTDTMIAEKCNISVGKIRYRRQKLGLHTCEVQKRRHTPSKKCIAVANLYYDFTANEISDKLGIALTTISSLIKSAKKHGLIKQKPCNFTRELYVFTRLRFLRI